MNLPFAEKSVAVSQRIAYLISLVMLLGFTLWIYSPGQYGPPLLDDRGSLLKLDALDANPSLARQYIFGDGSGPLGRPVSMASFVAEKLYLNHGTPGTKLINIALHLFTGALVVCLFSLLLSYQKIPAHRWFSLLGAAAWLLSPLYVSTVLYMVQRMTILATLFMVASLICYVLWRNALVLKKFSWHYLVACAVLFLLALFSKENAAILLPIIVLMEVFWFRGCDREGLKHAGLHLVSISLLVLGVISAFVLLACAGEWIQAGYAARDFSLGERLLTQSRVLWHYVGQVYVPETFRMGLFHDDVVVSRTLLEPFSTLISVVSWSFVGLGVLALCFARVAWTVVFATLWFLVGHSVESTALALELYFEHRNYFPGIGLILLLLCLVGMLCKRYAQLSSPLLVCGCFYVLYLALQASSQVQIWSSTPLLRISTVIAHPESARANEEMAVQLAGVGALTSALEYSRKSDDLDSRTTQGDRQLRDLSLHCLANVPVPQHLIDNLGRQNPKRPFAVVSIASGLVKLLQEDGCPSFDRLALAERLAKVFLVDDDETRASANMFSVFASFENDLGRYGNAFEYIELSLSQVPDAPRPLLMKLHFATALGKVSAADEVIEMLQKKREAGMLSTSEQRTLELYLEN